MLKLSCHVAPFPERDTQIFFLKSTAEGAHHMFCVIYTFTVKPGYENEFRQHWSAVTQSFYHHAGSLGSRLHRASTGEYIAYAQWQTRAQWEQQGNRSDAELQTHRQAMRDVCEKIEVLYELEMTDDWLQGKVYRGGA
jgi:heme-degrading monooxygenase HmoA